MSRRCRNRGGMDVWGKATGGIKKRPPFPILFFIVLCSLMFIDRDAPRSTHITQINIQHSISALKIGGSFLLHHNGV